MEYSREYWIVLSIILTIFLLFVFDIPRVLWSYYKLCKLVRPIPGWPTHWLHGNLHQKGDGYIENYNRWAHENKHVISKEWLGPFTVQINVNHPDLVKELLNIPKARWIYHTIELWLGEGLLISEGKLWARNRRLLTKAFHFEVLKPYVQVYNECTDILIDKWLNHAKNGKPVSVHADVSKLTLDILLRCSLNTVSNCQLDGDCLPYIEAVQSLSELSVARYSSVLLAALNDTIYLNCTPLGRLYKKTIKIAHDYAEKVIQERNNVLGLYDESKTMEEVLWNAKKSHKYLDFLDILLTARDEDGQGLSDLEIRYEVDTFLFEGHDTTAHGLSWTLYCLAKYPEHQEKCREEVNEILGSRTSIEYDDLAKLSYIQWCIKESHRLYPPVYSAYKKFNQDTQLGGYTIPKQCIISQKHYVIHHSPEFWKKPYVFDPLRFHPDNTKDRHPYSYVPFSAGQRNCIGQNFAMNEERVVITMILRKFRLRLVENHDVVMITRVLLTTKNDIKIFLEPLSD